jgi:hypothetical protein
VLGGNAHQDFDLGSGVLDLGEVVGGEVEPGRADVLLQPF